MVIGFIGQGFIGKNYADDFEERGYTVVRYSLDPVHAANKDRIAECDVVFIAVPTPTTPTGFDDSAIRAVLPLVGKGKIAVIKSTVLPGCTEEMQKANPNIVVLHSPEFLREVSAAEDVRHPTRNIIGMPIVDQVHRAAAESVMATLPPASYSAIVQSKESELIKYAANNFLHIKVVYANMLYDLAQKLGADWNEIKKGLGSDHRIGPSHLDPVHTSGRGAGGHCFIKDFAAFRMFYEEHLGDTEGNAVLEALEQKNVGLLRASNKDLDLLTDVYGV